MVLSAGLFALLNTASDSGDAGLSVSYALEVCRQREREGGGGVGRERGGVEGGRVCCQQTSSRCSKLPVLSVLCSAGLLADNVRD